MHFDARPIRDPPTMRCSSIERQSAWPETGAPGSGAAGAGAEAGS